MPSDKDGDQDATQASEALYVWWLNLLPNLLGGLLPKATMPSVAPAGEASATAPFPVGQASQALALTQQLLEPLFQSYMKALTLNPEPDQAFGALQSSVQDQLQKLSHGLAGIGKTLALAMPDGASAGAWNLMGVQPMAMFGQALKPLSTNLERAYGGLADAFGLAPSRDLLGAARDAANAAMAKQQAQAEYLGYVVNALAKGSEGLMSRLKTMGDNGESVDSLLGLVRLWARTSEEALHAALQSPPALQASARLVRAGTQSRRQQQRIVALASEALNVPTRAEVDDAYREIQELKREVRRLRKAIGAPLASTSPAAASNGASASPAAAEVIDRTPPTAAKPSRQRTPAAKRKTTSKAIAS